MINFKEIRGGVNLLKQVQGTRINEDLIQSLGLTPGYETLPLEYYETDKSSVVISPKRGGTIPSLILDNKELFYNDPEKRNDIEQSLRESFWMGPQGGKFSEKQLQEYLYRLKQHGVLRDGIRERQQITANEIAHIFRSSQETMRRFPHKFATVQRINLEEDTAKISLDIANMGNTPMRFAPGHHTYYNIHPNLKSKIKLDKNMGVNDEKKDRRIHGQETIHIPNPGSSKIYLPGIGDIQLDFDPKFSGLRLRSEADKGFVCIEPVTCSARDWMTSSLLIQPGQMTNIGFSVKLLAKE